MTFADIACLARRLLNDSDCGFYSADILYPAINAANDVANSILIRLRPRHYFLVSGTRSTVINTKSYAIPIDASFIVSVQRIESLTAPDVIIDELRPYPIGGSFGYDQRELSPIQFNFNGPPTHYVVRRQQIDLYPTPDAVYAMKIWYDQRGAKLLNDTDVPAAPDNFHYWIGMNAAYLASLSNPVERRDDLLAQYKKRETEFIDELANSGANDEALTRVGMFGI